MKTTIQSLVPVVLLVCVVIMLGSLVQVAQAYIAPEDRLAGENSVFSTLSRQVYLTSSTTAALSYTDLVGTTLQPPYRLKVRNVGSWSIYRGLTTSPTATCTPIAASAEFDEVYHTNPNTYLKNPSSATNLIVEVWTRQ